MRWFVLIGIVIANAIGLFYGLMPILFSYAEVPPPGITCALCSDPEVLNALTAAATYGRGSIIGPMTSSAQWLFGLALLNVAVIAFALFWRCGQKKDSVVT